MKRFSLIFVFFLLSCVNPFSPREPEQPSTPSGHYEIPTSPEKLVSNLYWSYSDRNLANFSTVLSDSFAFSASAEDSLANPELFAFWNCSVELDVTGRMFQSGYVYLELSISEDFEDYIGEETANLYREYILIVEGSSATSSAPAEGVALFELEKEDNDWWHLVHWTDIPSSSVSWADVKSEFR